MAVTREARSWNDLFAARTRAGVGAGSRRSSRSPANTDADPVRGRLPRPQTFPAAAAATLLAELVAAGDASAFQYAPTRGLPGPLDALADRLEALPGPAPRRRRAADHERRRSRRSSCSASRSSTRATSSSSRARRTSARSWRSAASRPTSSRCRSTTTASRSTSSTRALAAGLRPKLLYTIPDHQNPAGRQPLGRAARRARRAGAPPRLPDRGGRRLPRARLRRRARRRACGASRPTPSCRSGTTSKTFFPGVRLGWAAGPAEVVAQLVVGEAEHRPVRGRARPAAVRGVRAPRLDGRAARALARAVPAPLRAAAGRARAAHARRRRPGRGPRAGSSRG